MPIDTLTQDPTTTDPQTTMSQNFADSFWDDKPMDLPTSNAPVNTPAQPNEPVKAADGTAGGQGAGSAAAPEEEDVFDANEYIKQELGFENWDVAKTEIEALRKLKETANTPAEIKFANEQSERLFNSLKEGKEDDLFEYLANKRELKRIESLDVNKVSDASEMLKLNMKLSYKDLTSDEINDLFSENYGKPKKPQQGLETDEEYQETLQEWEAKCNSIDKKIIRDAKIKKPDFAKFNEQITLPDIPSKTQPVQEQPTPEDVEADKKNREMFLKSATEGLNAFKGFSASVKDDKDAELVNINYGLSNEEKTFLQERINLFADSNYNANAILSERWVKDGKINQEQMIKDLSLLYNQERILSKMTQETYGQTLEKYVKEKKNLNLNQPVAGNFPDPEKNDSQRLQETFWNN